MVVSEVHFYGAGYVGGITATYFASQLAQLKFIVYDINDQLIEKWNTGTAPFHEPKLQELLSMCLNKNLFFTSDISQVLIANQNMSQKLVFLCINTPSDNDFNLKTDYLQKCIQDIAQFYDGFEIDGHVTLILKSTVPVQSIDLFKQLIRNNLVKYPENTEKIELVSNPEFLAEGQAIQNLSNPDRVVLGSSNYESIQFKQILNFYNQYLNIGLERIIQINQYSSELGKIVANCFLAQRVSSINSIAAICENTKADVQQIKQIVQSDHRIGKDYLNPGVGFGGSCLKKDLQALIYLAHSLDLNEVAEYWQQVLNMNYYQQSRTVKIVVNRLKLQNKCRICVIGVAFKPDSSDVRNSQNILVILQLIKNGFNLQIYDSHVDYDDLIGEMKEQNKESRVNMDQHQIVSSIQFSNDAIYNQIDKCNAILILSDFQILQQLEFTKIKSMMNQPYFIFDFKNCLTTYRQQILDLGFNLYQLGK